MQRSGEIYSPSPSTATEVARLIGQDNGKVSPLAPNSPFLLIFLHYRPKFHCCRQQMGAGCQNAWRNGNARFPRSIAVDSKWGRGMRVIGLY